MAFHRKQFVYFALGASILSLGACGYNHPNAMPGGYTYHHETYKSPTPPTSSKITVEQRKYMDETQAEQFRNSVYDLLEKLTMRAGLPPKPVYIMAPDPMTTFYANLDNDLRESMRHIGYAISDTSQEAYIFTYEAQPIENSTVENVFLTLRVFSGLGEEGRQLTEESGAYFIQGADSLKIMTSRYDILPTLEQEQPQTVEMVEPVVSIVKPITETTIVPIMAEPAVEAPVKSVVISTPIKDPSRDDIVIINRGEEAIVPVENMEPIFPVVEDVLQEDAIPSLTEPAVRTRVSLPVDY